MSAPIPTSSFAEKPSRWRRAGISALLWVYGISITIFLFSIWGRAVASDTGLLATAASRAADSDVVSGRVQDWFDRVLADAGLGEAGEAAASLIMAVPEVRSATRDLVGEVVGAAAEPSPGVVVVEVADIYRPAVPAVTSALASAGLPVSEEQVAAVVDELDPLVLRTAEGPPMVGPASGTSRSLTIATLIALFTLVASGGWVVMLSDDRRAMARSLLNRLAVSAFTYAVFFRVSSWVLDPGGGRASVRGGIAEVVGSKLWIPLSLTVVAAGGGWAVRHRDALPHLRVRPGRSTD